MRKREEPGQVIAIIPAAGSGKRIGTDIPKQFLSIGSKPLVVFTLEAFEQAALIDAVILVVPESEISFCEENIVRAHGLKKVIAIVSGGKRRQDSVRKGLEATRGRYPIVVIHDGARPFVEPELIDNVVEKAKKYRAVIAGVPARDTIKLVDSSGIIEKTLHRQTIWLAQTPQAFYYEDIARAHQKALDGNWGELTDDAAFVERIGIPVKVVMGSDKNIKVTTPADLELARFFIDNFRQAH